MSLSYQEIKYPKICKAIHNFIIISQKEDEMLISDTAKLKVFYLVACQFTKVKRVVSQQVASFSCKGNTRKGTQSPWHDLEFKENLTVNVNKMGDCHKEFAEERSRYHCWGQVVLLLVHCSGHWAHR